MLGSCTLVTYILTASCTIAMVLHACRLLMSTHIDDIAVSRSSNTWVYVIRTGLISAMTHQHIQAHNDIANVNRIAR